MTTEQSKFSRALQLVRGQSNTPDNYAPYDHSYLPFAETEELPIVIAVMGMTGAGKSTFISTVTGQYVEIGHGLGSCTQEIQVIEAKIGSHTIHFIDTPGFDDTDRTDAEILENIAEYLKISKYHNVRLSGILYLHPITAQRIGRTAMKNLRMFRKLVGDNNFNSVIFLTTMWSKVDPTEGASRHQELTGTGKFWGGMITAGAKAAIYDGTLEAGLRIVGTALKNTPIVMQIQQELARYGNLGQTSAGREVQDSLKALQAQHEKELAELRELVATATQARNMELLEELQSHYDELIKQLEEANDTQKRLNEVQVDSLGKRIKELEERWTCIIS